MLRHITRQVAKTFRPVSSRSKRSTNNKELSFEKLENRQLLAATIAYDSNADVVSIYGTNYNDFALIEYETSGRVNVVAWDVSATNRRVISEPVREVRFYGYDGVDWLRNDTAIKTVVYGMGGDDQLIGGSGADVLDGGQGNDMIWGRDGGDQIYGADGDDQLMGGNGNDWLDGGYGSDRIWGESGFDKLCGGDGNDVLAGGNESDLLIGGWGDDTLYGGYGDDQLNGGTGRDFLIGEDGNDTLVAIDNTFSDQVDGGYGSDTLWINSSSGSDQVVGATSADKVHRIGWFSNSADMTLDGDRIADPATTAGYAYRNFGSLTLFASTGPSLYDVQQGQIGDCYFLAGLGAIAQKVPTAIRQNIVDFNDGTFGVRLGSKFYRVDSDLAVFNGSASLAYANFGAGGAAWVALYEKAFAHYRTGQNSYASIANGWSAEAFTAFGIRNGSSQASTFGNANYLINQMHNTWHSGSMLTVASLSVLNGGPLVANHVYIVTGFLRNTFGAITHVILRNPWAVDGANIRDGVNDGNVTLSASELFPLTRMIEWGRA